MAASSKRLLWVTSLIAGHYNLQKPLGENTNPALMALNKVHSNFILRILGLQFFSRKTEVPSNLGASIIWENIGTLKLGKMAVHPVLYQFVHIRVEHLSQVSGKEKLDTI